MGANIRIYRLSGGEYKRTAKSSSLTGVSAHTLTRLLADGQRMNRIAWFKHIRQSVAAK